MNALAFIQKWRRADLTERSASQQHFLDLCEVVEHPKPAEADITAEAAEHIAEIGQSMSCADWRAATSPLSRGSAA